jgi:esterase
LDHEGTKGTKKMQAGSRTFALVSRTFLFFVSGMVNLSHQELGGAGNPPLVLLHGLLGSSRNWLTAGRDLARHFHVLALDARNHGRSPHAATMNYQVMMQDIIHWMDAHHLARAVIVGHSMGGKTAMRLACRHPERVIRLVVVDIAPKDYRWAAHRAEFAALNELDLDSLHSRQEAEMRFEARVPNLGMRKFLTTNLERSDEGRWRWTINLPVLTEALSILEHNSLEPDDRFNGPTLFITGGLSQYVQAHDQVLIQRLFPAARVAVMPDSGHNPHMDQRDAFVRLVQGF